MTSTSGTTDISTASGTPPLVVNGLISGLNTPGIIQALMTPYQEPITNLQNEQTTLQNQAGDYTTVNSDLIALQAAAEAINLPTSGWNAMTATSSDTDAATATAEPGTVASTVSFTVHSLAQSNVQVSTGAVASTNTVVTSASSLLLSQASQLGFAALGAVTDSGLSLGKHTIEVTQASAAASTTGTSPLAADTVIQEGTNDTIDVTVNGTPTALVIAPSGPGGYTPSQLVSAIDAAANAVGAPVAASLDDQGDLILGTTEQDSSASLQVTGGNALPSLNLGTMASAVNGTDAIVDVDGQANDVSAIIPGGTTLLTSGNGGSIQVTFGSTSTPGTPLVSTGSTKAVNVSTGNGSLSQVIANINQAGAGMTANTVDTTNGYILQLTSTSTGAPSQITVDPSSMSSTLGSLTTAQAGQDAQIYLNGNPEDTVASATNTFTGLLPGLSVDVQQTTTDPISVTTSADGSSVAGLVQNLVTAANQVLSDIGTYTAYTKSTNSSGPLNGSVQLADIQRQVLSLFGSAVGSSDLGNVLAAGISVSSSGTISFNQSTFLAAFQADPTQVTNLFVQGGTLNASSPDYDGSVSLSYAGSQTQAGNYDVTISQSATQATDNGAVLAGGTVSTPETLTVKQGGTSVDYTTSSGQSLGAIATGLNAAFASAGMSLSAQVIDDGDQLQITSAGYGSGQTFSAESTDTGPGTTGLAGDVDGTPTSFTGQDVAGSIDGVASTGSGQFLTAPDSNTNLDGISLQVTASGITSPTSIGTYSFQPGLAQVLTSATYEWSNPVNGLVTGIVNNLNSQATGLNSQISEYQLIADNEQKMLQSQYAQLEGTLGSLKNQGSMLTAELSAASANSVSSSSSSSG